ncbi:hypothetical protein Q8F55_000024 [Vanrija albida]|uniref:F-box domain containing protein n=1 Tax=Vanrija albida TaxID=181172 RepID=A0ABR3QCA8_9TREE
MALGFDYTAYPHLMDAVLASAPVPALLVLRGTSRSFRSRVDARLFGHVRVEAAGGKAPSLRDACSGHPLPSKPELVCAADVGSGRPGDTDPLSPLVRLDTLRRSGDAMYAAPSGSGTRHIPTVVDYIDLHPPPWVTLADDDGDGDGDDDDEVYGDVLGRRFSLDLGNAERWTVCYPFSVNSYTLHIRLDTASTMPKLWRYFFDGMAALSAAGSLKALTLVVHAPAEATAALLSMTLVLAIFAAQQAVTSMNSGSVTFVGVDSLGRAAARLGGDRAEVDEWLRQVRVFGQVWAPHLDTRWVSMETWRGELAGRAGLEGE